VRAADRQGVMTRRRALTGGPQPQCQAAALADRRAQRHSAGRRGFKLDSKIFQTDSKFSKLWLFEKVSSLSPKMGNKIWLERTWDEEELCLKNFPQIRNGFGTKIQRTSMSWISIEIYWKFLELWISMRFGQQAPCYTLLPGKN
jgi:hypothetical protein